MHPATVSLHTATAPRRRPYTTGTSRPKWYGETPEMAPGDNGATPFKVNSGRTKGKRRANFSHERCPARSHGAHDLDGSAHRGGDGGEHRAVLLGELESPPGRREVHLAADIEGQSHADETPRRHVLLLGADRHLHGVEILAFLAEDLHDVVGETRR